jgi:hypothetical protein
MSVKQKTIIGVLLIAAITAGVWFATKRKENQLSADVGKVIFLGAAETPAPAKPKKPRIPLPKKKPSIPQNTAVLYEKDEVSQWLTAIEGSVQASVITEEDIRRGFYYGSREDLKQGTPMVWVFIEDGKNSRWSSPNSDIRTEEIEKRILCEETGGTYVPSCLSSESATCDYVPESRCACTLGTQWNFKQGCLKLDSNNEPLRITQEEVAQGFYKGEKTEKKLGTPAVWSWTNIGSLGPRWENPKNQN